MIDMQKIAEEIRAIYNPKLLENKVILVTGGSRGIGRALCAACGALGAHVIINYAGNEKAAAETQSGIEALGGKATIIQFNVADFAQTHEAIKNLEKTYGGIDVLINNAGITRDSLLIRAKEDDWDQTLDTNLKGAFNCAHAVAMGMIKKRSGSIINISSVIGLVGNIGQTAYAASKAGLIGFTKSLARELASRGIIVNAVAPGFITTDMTASLDEKVRAELLRSIPMERFGEGLDVAKLVVFLASPAASYITGQVLTVDGGMTMVG